jgi:hypothetical protein
VDARCANVACRAVVCERCRDASSRPEAHTFRRTYSAPGYPLERTLGQFSLPNGGEEMGGRRKEGHKPKLRELREAQRGTIRSFGLAGAVAMALLGVWGALFWQPGKVIELSTEAPATQLRKVVAGVPPWLIHCKTKTGQADSDQLAAQAAMVRRPSHSDCG